jgi:hypothetical protein
MQRWLGPGLGKENKTWLLTAFGPEAEGEGEAPPAGRTIDVSGAHGDGRQTPQPSGNSSVPDKSADQPQDRGPVTLGMGLGAFEPFLRESIEDMRALKAARDAALEELERSKITTGEKRWGERVRHFFTATRDLWAARSNQGIAKVRKLTYQYRNRRTGVDTSAEAMAIAREFKGNTDELLARNPADLCVRSRARSGTTPRAAYFVQIAVTNRPSALGISPLIFSPAWRVRSQRKASRVKR